MLRTALLLSLLFIASVPGSADMRFSPEDGWTSLFDGSSLSGWAPMSSEKPNTWQVAANVRLDPSHPAKLAFDPYAGSDGVMINGPDGKAVNFITIEPHGDVELYLEFMVPKGSNSGVYLQGLYEIQVLDSWGKDKSELKYGDCGGIYARYINQQVVAGTPPPVNASRPPGEWQDFHIWFQAPRFDSGGNKTANARFVKVVHNGVTLHQNVEVEGPTRAHMKRDESPRGPLMLQGDHGPVAYRNIYMRPLKK